jgi:hypothetical protein
MVISLPPKPVIRSVPSSWDRLLANGEIDNYKDKNGICYNGAQPDFIYRYNADEQVDKFQASPNYTSACRVWTGDFDFSFDIYSNINQV